MGGGGLGGKGAMKGTSVPAATQAPTIEYIDPSADATMQEEKSKAQKALLAMKGRQSTILTPDKLGDVAINKRQLLGA
jgi:hypothetical protein